jgi:hypothetical protein
MKTEEIYHWISEITEAVENGESKALEARMMLSDLEKVTKAANDKIRPYAVSEFESGVNTFNGFKVERMQSGTWDYSSSPEWLKKKSELEMIQEEMKSAYKLMSGNDLHLDITEEGILINDRRIIPANYNPNNPTVKFTKIK